jgi:uracil phosphoribosyltransferase
MSEHVNEPSRRAFVFAAATLGTAFASGMLSINPSHAFAVTAAEKQAEADAVRDQLVSLQADLELCADRYYAALEAVDAAIAERDAAHEAMEAEQVKIDETTARIEEIQDRLVIVTDPMLATGGSACDALEMLKKRGCNNIRLMCLVGAPEGIAKVQAEHPDVDIYLAAVDERLNENAYIVPGLGDAGDRIFGTK